jgi:hypothetical protein
MGVNLLNIYTPKELAEKTIHDIRLKKYKQKINHEDSLREADRFIRERAYVNKKMARK